MFLNKEWNYGSEEAGNNREKFLGSYKVFSQGDVLKGKYWLYVLLFLLFFSFLFVKLHSIYNYLCFDSIRFDKIDVLGVQRAGCDYILLLEHKV